METALVPLMERKVVLLEESEETCSELENLGCCPGRKWSGSATGNFCLPLALVVSLRQPARKEKLFA